MNQIAAAPSAPKAQALAAAAAVQPEATGLVEFRSEGRVLLIGEPVLVNAALAQLDPQLQPHCLFVSEPAVAPKGIPFRVCAPGSFELEGYLGRFRIRGKCRKADEQALTFDLVVDLLPRPLLAMATPPIGYFAPGTDQAALRPVLEELPDLIGRFEKPQFFAYDPAICAHGASGLEGCRRCLDTCPTQAIVSVGEKVQVDPNLCQGGGICTAVCPTGAMTYRYPPAADSLERIRRMLHTFLEAGGEEPVLLLHALADDPGGLAEEELPMPLEELASAGLELWLAALAYGATQVRLLRSPTTDERIAAALEEQRAVANAILCGLGYAEAVHWHDAPQTSGLEGLARASFAAAGDKRQNLFLAVDHLYAHAPQPVASAPLPPGAPLGRIRIRREGCTLCLACVSVCPARALSDGGEKPAVRLFEANCVQCGLCAKACPEKVITLESRIVYEPGQRRAPQVLNEEEPFHCIACGKPFATRSVMEKMQTKLSGHWMFQDEATRRRLMMCGDCRVVDMMRDQS
jgi:ferredoxin